MGVWADGVPVGHVFLKRNPVLPDGYEAHASRNLADIENLFFAESLRSKGIGSANIGKAEETACSQGCVLLGAAVDPEKEPTRIQTVCSSRFLRHWTSCV